MNMYCVVRVKSRKEILPEKVLISFLMVEEDNEIDNRKRVPNSNNMHG